jgi:hypothetical protein
MKLLGAMCDWFSATARARARECNAGLLPNGNFERSPLPSQLRGTRVVGASAIPSWQTSGFVEYISSGQKQGDMVLVVPEGAYAVRLGNEASIRQRLRGAARGARYSLTFSAARTCAQAEQLNVSASGQSGLLAMQTMYSSNGWDSYAWAWVANADEVDIVIHNPGVTEDPACGPLIDSVAIKTLNPPRRTNSKHAPTYAASSGVLAGGGLTRRVLLYASACRELGQEW